MQNSNPIPVVLIAGLKNSGKNTFGDLLLAAFEKATPISHISYRPSFRATAFADPIKRVVQEVCGIHPHVLWGNSEIKESTFTYGKSVRQILQWLGTEVFRDNLHPDIWVDATVRHIQSTVASGWVITDCRFPNEWTRARDTLPKSIFQPWLVKVVRPSCGVNTDSHRSETEVDKLDQFSPITVCNDGTLEDLTNQAGALANWLLLDRANLAPPAHVSMEA